MGLELTIADITVARAHRRNGHDNHEIDSIMKFLVPPKPNAVNFRYLLSVQHPQKVP